MVNVGFSFASLLGILFAIGGAGLYFLRQFRPNLARDYDVFFAAVGLSTGIILFFFGWQLEPVHQINTLLLTCTVFFFAYESIRLRGVTVEQAKRRTPVVDDDRPVSRVYRAELDDREQMDSWSNRRQIPSSRDNYRDDDYYGDRYQQRPPYEEPRRPAGRLKPSEEGRRRRPPEADQWRERPPESSDWGDGPRRPPQAPQGPPGENRRPPNDERGPRSGGGNAGGRRERGDRTLNVRPYSERPGEGGGQDGGYVDFRPVNPPPEPPPERP